MDTIWKPKNSGKSEWEGKNVTLRFGLAHSINWITAWVLDRFTPQMVVDMAHSLGVKSKIEPVYSVILGTSGISLEEMTTAYCVYANKGVHQDPVFVTQIEDKNGNLISSFVPRPTEVISEYTAYLMLNLMEDVVKRGTAVRLIAHSYPYQFKIPIAGKTGTTQNHSDGWFIGITPNLVTGVWVGAEDRSVHFDNITQGQGANMALPIWAIYMKSVVARDSVLYHTTDFEEPEGFTINLDCDDSSDPRVDALEDIIEFESN
jgi:penicillin-binding protein 1A